MAELDPYYSGSKTAVQSQLDAAPAQQDAELAGLDAKLGQANDNILNSARQRGMGFSGIPIAEQAKYAATDYAPAVANLKAKYVGQKNTLLEALNSLGRDQLTQAQGIYDNEANRDIQLQQLAEQKRQFDAQQAAAAKAAASGGGSYSLGGGSSSGGGSSTASAAKIARTANGGFNFFSSEGRAINAAQYASIMGVGYRQLLSQMAAAGDNNAKIALQYVGNDAKFGNAPAQYKGALSAVGATGTFASGTKGGSGW